MPHGNTPLGIHRFLSQPQPLRHRFYRKNRSAGRQGNPRHPSSDTVQRVAAARGWQHPGGRRTPVEGDVVGARLGHAWQEVLRAKRGAQLREPAGAGPAASPPRWGRDILEGPRLAGHPREGRGTPQGSALQKQGKGRPGRCSTEADPGEGGGRSFLKWVFFICFPSSQPSNRQFKLRVNRQQMQSRKNSSSQDSFDHDR